ncbi:MAG: hypothetical protein ACKVT2_05585 [Saprospiraceae bacterium]
MEIAFGLIVLALIVLGLINRKKEKKVWVEAERFEESGNWIDKRSGERGTYGSLDDEMEAGRRYIANKSKISILAQAIQSFLFLNHPGFSKLENEKIKHHLSFCKSEVQGLLEHISMLESGQVISLEPFDIPDNDLRTALKKQVLDLSFEHFPRLLDLEIEEIKRFDLATEVLASRVLSEIERINHA